MVRDEKSSGTLSDFRLVVTACLLGFSGFLHCTKLVALRPCDCSVAAEMLKVNIMKSKNDQLCCSKEMRFFYLRPTPRFVDVLERYMAKTGMRWVDDCFIFQTIQKTKNGESLRQSGRISYSYILDLFTKMSTLAFEAMEFGLHSLKSGGAKTTANAGVLDQLFTHHSQQ